MYMQDAKLLIHEKATYLGVEILNITLFPTVKDEGQVQQHKSKVNYLEAGEEKQLSVLKFMRTYLTPSEPNTVKIRGQEFILDKQEMHKWKQLTEGREGVMLEIGKDMFQIWLENLRTLRYTKHSYASAADTANMLQAEGNLCVFLAKQMVKK